MKNVIMLHGTGETPNSFWYPYIKYELEEKGYEVWLPQLPNKDTPRLEDQLPFVLENGKFSKRTIIIGHSAGAPLALSVLENIRFKIRQAILVAGFIIDLKGGENGPNLILQKKYDWQRIKKHVEDLILIHSDNDPWGCDDNMGLLMFRHLGGTLIVRRGEGHMGSQSFNQPYREFPFLLKIVD